MERTVIASFARTPFGKLGGSLKKFKATELGGFALREAINRAGIDPAKLDLTIMGQVITAGCGQVLTFKKLKKLMETPPQADPEVRRLRRPVRSRFLQ